MKTRDRDMASSPPSAAATKKRLLEAGTEEFYRVGYKQASLRKICKICGVTTGAFYFSFTGKQDLFQSIVDPVITRLLSLAEALVQRELEHPSTGQENGRKIMEFELQYRRELIILMEKSEGSGREHIKDLFFQRMLHYFTIFFEKELGHPPNPDMIKLLVSIRMQANLNLLKEDYDMEKMLLFNDILSGYADGGFEYLIQNFRDRL